MEYTELTSKDGSRTWRLRYNNAALRWFESHTGIKFTQINPSDLGMEETTMLLAAGIRHENKDVTIEDADEVIDSVGMSKALHGVMTAIENDLGVDDSADDPAGQNGTAPKNVSGTGEKLKPMQPR